MSKYDYLKFEMFPEEVFWGDWIAKPQAYFRGETSLPGARYHVGFQVLTKDIDVEVPHFHHHAEEYIMFLGTKMPDVFDFDAHIEMEIGNDPDHMETIVIDKPSVIRIPPNTWHCPIHCHLKKPILFQAAYLDGTWGKIIRGEKKADGEMFKYEYYFEGDNVRFCKFNPKKRCDICGKCYENINAEGYNANNFIKE